MKYKIRNSGKTKKQIEVHISKEIIAGELDRIYRDIARNATLPGFRTGKAPMDAVRKRYKSEAEEEATKNLLGESLNKAITESKMDVLGYPKVSELVFDIEKGMSYKADLNTRPEIKFKNYKGFTLKKSDKQVQESDVDAQVNSIREMSSRFVTKEGSAEQGDYLICDIDCSVDDKTEEKKENTWLYVGEDAFIPGKELEGLKVGDEKSIKRDIPKDYSKKEVAGKPATFNVKVKEIKKKILPELDDEFASKAGGFKSLAELREAIRENLKQRFAAQSRRELEVEALGLLDKAASFEAPQFMVDSHLETLVKRAKEKLKREQYPKDQIDSMESDIRERLKGEALREVRAYFILDEITKLEKIEVTDLDLEAAFEAMAASSGSSADEARKHYEKNDLMHEFTEDIRQKKALDFVINNSNVK